jgi:hypothetical protein
MKHQAKAVTVIVATMLALAAWWFVRAPATTASTARPRDIDIAPPLRVRREAALALVTTQEDPRSFAETLAPSAPAKAADREDCGIQDGPRFDKPLGSEDPLVQIGGASPRFVLVQASIDAALRSSPDPLDRAVADLVNAGDMRSESGRDEAVVQQAAVTTDARVYALGYGLCHSARPPVPSCQSISLDRWIQLDPGNGIPWLEMLGQAQARGDPAGVRAAISQLASATRFDIYTQSAAGAVASRMPTDDQSLAAVNDLMSRALLQEATLPIPAFHPLMQVCRDKAGGNEELERMCRSISDVMYEHSDNLISEAISGALLLQSTGDASRRELIRAERAAFSAHWSPATGFSECRDLRDSIKRVVRTAQMGEVEASRAEAKKFVTP